MRDMYAEQTTDLRIATSVPDRDTIRGLPINVAGNGSAVYVRDVGELCFYHTTSIVPDADGIAYVPTFVSETAEYQDDPTTAPGRWIVHSVGLGSGAPMTGVFAPVRVATMSNLAATLQTDGVTLLANANGALGNIDSITLAVGDRVLIAAQTASAANGIYIVTSLGGVSAKYAFVRARDMFIAEAVVPGMQVTVTSGSVNAGKVFEVVVTTPVVLGTTAIAFRPLAQEAEVTLVAGVATLSNVWVSARTGVLVELKTPGGTMGARLKIAKTLGAGTGSVVITAVDASGATVATDTSTLFVKLVD